MSSLISFEKSIAKSSKDALLQLVYSSARLSAIPRKLLSIFSAPEYSQQGLCIGNISPTAFTATFRFSIKVSNNVSPFRKIPPISNSHPLEALYFSSPTIALSESPI